MKMSQFLRIGFNADYNSVQRMCTHSAVFTTTTYRGLADGLRTSGLSLFQRSTSKAGFRSLDFGIIKLRPKSPQIP